MSGVWCLRRLRSVYLSRGCLTRRCRSAGLSVCLSPTLERVWALLPGVPGLEGREKEGRWQPGGAGRGGGGDSGRAGAPCGPEGCVRGAGGGCHCRLSLRRGTLAASSSRRGPTRPA